MARRRPAPAVVSKSRGKVTSPATSGESEPRDARGHSSVHERAHGHRYAAIVGVDDAGGGAALVAHVRKGLPYQAFERFVTNTTLTPADAATLIDIPARTLARRKSEGRFQPDESDRLLRASRVVSRAIALFEGDREEATHWLSRPARALHGATPLDLARTEVGALEVEWLIDKLEHGVII